jgi:hypothetical protein
VLLNDILPDGCNAPQVSIHSYNPTLTTPPTVDANNRIIYTGNQAGLDTVVYEVTCGTLKRQGEIHMTIGAAGTAFVDDVWYFGSASATGAGIRFVKDGTGQYTVQDASNESKANSWENSLTVSSPYCNGQVVFYSSHNQLYNSLHEPLKNGGFAGNSSISDGLAACYMGNNKYLFFTVTTIYNNRKELRAYVVDMNADNGKGARVAILNEQVEASHYNMGETIGLIAKANTTHQYWLVYPHRSGTENSNNYSNEMRVRLIDVSNPNNPSIGSIEPSPVTKTDSRTYTMAVSPQNDRIAVMNLDGGSVDIFEFNSATGVLSGLRTITGAVTAYAYGLEFSPDGNQLYCSGYGTASAMLYQYDLSGSPIVQVTDSPIQYWSQTTQNTKGGGLKLGPDGKIYVTLSYSSPSRIGAISDPNATTSLTGRYNRNAISQSITYDGIQFSTGLTKPALMSCNMNTAPVTVNDAASICVTSTSRTAQVNVLANDVDLDGDTIFLTNAAFVNPADTSLAELTVIPADSTVTLTLKPSVILTACHVFDIVYDVKDNGLPASQCNKGMFAVTACPVPSLSSPQTPPAICTGTAFNYTATCALPGTTFSWSRAAVAGIQQGASSGNSAVISETLTNTNTTVNPVTLTYAVTLTLGHCTNTQDVTATVLPLHYAMRWTGLMDSLWHNPDNWVGVATAPNGQPYETPVSWYPQACTNVLIPSDMPRYPELDAPARCDTVTMQNRAMLANPHALTYTAAWVELKLKSTERDRFVMWSAPLLDMYSGDYHFKDAVTGLPRWGDVSMNYFQWASPRGGNAQANMFTATFGEPNDSLAAGKAFNVKLTSTSLSREVSWIFPQSNSVYYSAGDRPAVPVPRTYPHRFITDGMTPDAATGRYRIAVRNDVDGSQLVQVVNPYLAWLRVDSFLLNSSYNIARLDNSGYQMWDGDVNSGFIAIRFKGGTATDGMRYVVNDLTKLTSLSPAADLVAPLQSFFVTKKTGVTARLDSVEMSPHWTTTEPAFGGYGGYTLRAAESEEGVLRIRATQGSGTSYAALSYDPNASPEYRGSEDVRCLFYDGNPLTLYALTSLDEPLSIYTDGSFGHHETPLGLRLTQAGEVKLEFTGLETFGHDVYLIDHERGNLEVNLHETPVYSFTATQASPALNGRLVLRMEYTGRGLTTDLSAPDTPAIRCHGLGGHIHVHAVQGTIDRLEVYNIPGALIYAADDGSTEYRIPAPVGIYIVKVRTDSGNILMEKVVVR